MATERVERFWRAVKPWLLRRLREPSTYLGLVLKAAGLIGLPLTDSGAGQLTELLAVLVGAGLVAWNQTGTPDDTDRAGA